MFSSCFMKCISTFWSSGRVQIKRHRFESYFFALVCTPIWYSTSPIVGKGYYTLRGNWVFRITLFLKSVFYKFFFYSSLYTFFLNFSILLYLFLLSIFFISLLLFYKNGHSRPLFLSFLLKLQNSWARLTLSWLKNYLSSGCLPIKQHRFESCLN